MCIDSNGGNSPYLLHKEQCDKPRALIKILKQEFMDIRGIEMDIELQAISSSTVVWHFLASKLLNQHTFKTEGTST